MKYFIALLIFLFSSSDLFAVNIFTRIRKRLVNFIQRLHTSSDMNIEPPVTNQELEDRDDALIVIEENSIQGLLNSFEAMECFYIDRDNGFDSLDVGVQKEVLIQHVNLFNIYFQKLLVRYPNGFVKNLSIDQWLQILIKTEIREKLKMALKNLNNKDQDNEAIFQIALNGFLEIIKAIHFAHPQRSRPTFGSRAESVLIVDLTSGGPIL